jgi:hypothetical protein
LAAVARSLSAPTHRVDTRFDDLPVGPCQFTVSSLPRANQVQRVTLNSGQPEASLEFRLPASDSPLDNTPEGIARLWEARQKAAKIEITAGATASHRSQRQRRQRGTGDDRLTFVIL